MICQPYGTVFLATKFMMKVSNLFCRMTNTGIRYRAHSDKEKLLPCLTLYALPAYRRKGFYFTTADFVRHTFNIEDIFNEQTLIDLKNESLYEVSYTNSLFYGRCFTICYKTPLPAKKILYIELSRKIDIKLLVHPKNDEFW